MLEQILSYINNLNPFLIVIVLFFFSFIENIFPPSPSDIVIVIGATIVANSIFLFIPILLITSLGSSLGFIVMYYVGSKFGEKVIRKGKLKFVKKEALYKADLWFSKYGYKLIIINRFLPGTRSVVSFFCGIHNLVPVKTFIYAAISSFLWYSLLIYLGVQLERNVQLIDKYLEAYSNIILSLTILLFVFIFIKFLLRKNKPSK
ncbi:DedA family protein [Melioribacteraceae bacterium 4301-Me]|uniref:DedA family protein n=1 Tax=Pyranulibacter aquaticus TaxID=3163344 RepID=UPI003599BA06